MSEFALPPIIRGFIRPVSRVQDLPRSALSGERCVVGEDCDKAPTENTVWVWNGEVWILPETDTLTQGVFRPRYRQWVEKPKIRPSKIQSETIHTVLRIMTECTSLDDAAEKICAHFWPDRVK